MGAETVISALTGVTPTAEMGASNNGGGHEVSETKSRYDRDI
jgi:hypothetical protein